MSKHTKGPWIQDRTSVILPGGREFQPRYTMVMQDQDVADARLIAAAPELLEALKGLHRWMHDNVGFEKCTRLDELACIAITKAEGSQK